MKTSSKVVTLLLVVATAIAISAWHVNAIYRECRSHGFSRRYCADQVDR